MPFLGTTAVVFFPVVDGEGEGREAGDSTAGGGERVGEGGSGTGAVNSDAIFGRAM